MNARRIAWSIVGLLSISVAARAGPVTWGFEGVVTLVEDDNDVLGGAVEVGSLLSGYYTFESTTPTISPGDGFYENALTDIFGAVGGTAITGPIGTFNRIDVLNDIQSADGYLLEAGVRFAGTNAFLQIGLGDSTGEMFQTNALPLVPPTLDQIDVNGALFALGTTDESLGINGTITGLFVVPEPGTGGLVAVGLLFLAVRRRKHRRSQGSP